MANVSVFRNTTSNESILSSPEMVINSIIDGTFDQYITYLRSLGKADYDAEKKNLTAVTWSGTFQEGTRKRDTMTSYSKLVVIDIDKLEESALLLLKGQLKDDNYVRYAFISPSGKGIKIVFEVNTDRDNHLAAFLHLKQYVEDKYLVKVDVSGKDECRLCYLSHDPSAIINQQSQVFEVDTRFGDVVSQYQQTAVSGPTTNNVEAIFNVCVKWVDRTKTYQDGEKNIYIHALACALNRCGVSQENAIMLIGSHLPTPDIKWHQSVRSAYFHNQAQYGSVQVKDIGNSSFEAPPYIKMDDDIVKNDIMRIAAGLYYYKIPTEPALDIVSKVARFYEGKGYLPEGTSVQSLMDAAIAAMQQQMAVQSQQSSLAYQGVDAMIKEIVSLDASVGIKTYIPPIDNVTGGLIPGNFYGLIGFGETYKSMLAQHITYHNAVNGVPVLYLNGEMAKIQFIERLAKQVFDINFRQKLGSGEINKDNVDQFISELMKATSNNVFTFSGTGFGKKSILSTIDHIYSTTGKKVKIVVMDGLSQMDQVGKEEAQANIYNSGVCKEISKEANGGEGVVMLSLIHCSGHENKLIRNTGTVVRGGSKMIANMDGYFSTSLFIDQNNMNADNPNDINYIEGKFCLRFNDKRGGTGVTYSVLNLTPRLFIEHEVTDYRTYELRQQP